MGENGSSELTSSSRWRVPPFCSLDRRLRAALHFPINIRLEKERARLKLPLVAPFFGSLCCMALPSVTSSSRYPLAHNPNLLSRRAMCCFVLNVLLGFVRAVLEALQQPLMQLSPGLRRIRKPSTALITPSVRERELSRVVATGD